MKIAVCDDDKGCLDSMKRLLAGYPGISRTEYYQNLSQLSEALENGMGYDLVLMDIEWEGNEQDGIAYAAQYNARSPQTRFIFVTAYDAASSASPAAVGVRGRVPGDDGSSLWRRR